MANIRPVVAIELDDPAVDGRIVPGYHHYGRNWLFDDAPDDPARSQWQLAGCEIIRGMNGLAPISRVKWESHALTDWERDFDANFFRISWPAITRPRVGHLHYTHSADAERGQATTATDYPPALQVSLLRTMPVDGQTLTPGFELDLLGEAGGRCFSLALPPPWEGQCVDRAYERRPTLYWWDMGEYDEREILAVYEGTGLQGSHAWAQAVAQQLQIEQIDEYLRIRLPGAQEEWIVWTGDHPVTRGRVRASWTGESGMINVSRLRPITWVYYRWVTLEDGRRILQWREPDPDDPNDEAEAIAQGYSGAYPFAVPRYPQPIPEWMNGAAGVVDYTIGNVGVEPPGWYLTAEEVADNRPMIHFTGSGGDARPVLWIFKEIRAPAGTTATPDPVTIYPDEIAWHRDNSWRDANFQAEIKDFEEAIELRPYHRAEFSICWDTGVGTPAPITRIIGYLDGAQVSRDGQDFSGFPVPALRASDHPTLKLDKKFMRHLPSLELWTVKQIFETILQGAGVRIGMITVDAAIADLALPRGTPPWEPRFAYEHDYGVIAALDEMLTDRLGVQWGWNASGYFARAKPVWTPGDTPDWTLDLDEADPDIMTYRLVATEDTSAWRNYVMRLSGSREQAHGVLWADPATLSDPDDPHYAGDDLWDIEGGAESKSIAGYMAYRRLLELRQYRVALEIECGRLDIEPDTFGEVNATLARVPAGSIFRALEEDGRAKGVEAKVTYTVGLEELGE